MMGSDVFYAGVIDDNQETHFGVSFVLLCGTSRGPNQNLKFKSSSV